MTLTTIEHDEHFLRTPCQEVDLEVLKANRAYYDGVFTQMALVMKENSGIGLAANQAGFPLRMCIVAVTKQPIYMVNPRLTFMSGEKITALEGCLSCPGKQVKVSRSNTVTVEYFDLDGVKHKLRANGLTARCIQHEIDHLDGTLILDNEVPKKLGRF